MRFMADSGHLRFPSQLFEALGEGLLTFVILWMLRNNVRRRGALTSFYVMGYALIRFVMEIFREPDAQLGLFFNLFSMGQILSLLMFVLGMFLYTFSKKETVL
jgi:phosphatidylglycerol:prolipoprotein diacylglycerol transferase